MFATRFRLFTIILPAILILTTTAATAYGLAEVWLPPASVEDVDSDCSKLATGWSKTEQHVWAAVCAGVTADLNEMLGKQADPRIPVEISKADRRISSNFLQTILFHEPFRDLITRHGVRVAGAYFDEVVDLREGILPWQIEFVSCRFESDVDLSGLRAKRQVSFEDSFIGGDLDMHSGYFLSHLLLIDAFLQKDLRLEESEVEGRLDMSGATVKGTSNMVSATVKSHVLTVGTTFQAMTLVEADIGGQLDMTGATVTGMFNMVSATVESHMLTLSATFQAMSLVEADIGGQLDMTKTNSVGALNLASTRIGWHLLLVDVPLRSVNLHDAQIGGDLDLRGSKIKDELNMASTKVGLNFKLGKEAFAKLNLKDTEFSRVITNPKSEKDDSNLVLKLKGFTYYHFEGLADNDRAKVHGRTIQNSSLYFTYHVKALLGVLYKPIAIVLCKEPISVGNVYVEWLAQDRTFSHQPYQKLATALRNDGESKKADEVLYAAKDRERCEIGTGLIGYLGLTLFQLALGHGIVSYIFRAFYWVMPSFVLTAWLVLWLTGERWRHFGAVHEPIGFWFSLDHFLPVIRLDTRFQKVKLRRLARLRIPLLRRSFPFPVRWYFYIHQIAGYVLVILVIAGLTGMMQ